MFVSLHIRSICERLSVMHEQVSVQLTSNSKIFVQILRKPLSGISDQRASPMTSPKWKTSDLRWPKFTLKYPPKWKTSDLRLPEFTPKYPPPPKWKTSDLRCPQFTPKYPPQNEKLQIWDDQSLLWNTPPIKNFRFKMAKVYSEIPPPPNEKLQI